MIAMATPKRKRKKEFSKILCVILISLFALCCFLAMFLSCKSYDSSVFMYIIPATGTTATAAVSFYFFKAKSENLSKQRIRFVLMKLLLEDRLTGEEYSEILREIENIDSAISNKIQDMTTQSYEDDNISL